MLLFSTGGCRQTVKHSYIQLRQCVMVTDLVAFGSDGNLNENYLPIGTILPPPATRFLLFWQAVVLLPGSLAAVAGCSGC